MRPLVQPMATTVVSTTTTLMAVAMAVSSYPLHEKDGFVGGRERGGTMPSVGTVEEIHDGIQVMATTTTNTETLRHQQPKSRRRIIEQTFVNACQSCHVGHPLGPAIWNNQRCIFDQKAGTLDPGFSYSRALQESGIIWTEETLDRWLESPQTLIPGTTMNFGTTVTPTKTTTTTTTTTGGTMMGIEDPIDRRLVIARLKSFCQTESDFIPTLSQGTPYPTSAPSTAPSSPVESSRTTESGGSTHRHCPTTTMPWLTIMTPALVTTWLLLSGTGRR